MMSYWCLCIQTLCVASIVFVDLPGNVECSIFENIDSLSSLLSTNVPVSTDFQNEKLRQIILSYSSTPQPPVFDNSQQAVPQPSIPSKSHIYELRSPIHYPIMPPSPSIPPDVEVFDPSTYSGAKPNVGSYPPTPFYPPEPQPPVFQPPQDESLPTLRPPFMRPNDVEILDSNMNKPISLDFIKGLELFTPFGDNDAVLFENRDYTRKDEKVDSKGESNEGADKINVPGQSTSNVKLFEEFRNTLKDTNNFVNSTPRDDNPMTPVINTIKSIMYNKFNAKFPRTYQVWEDQTDNVTKNEIPDNATNTQENYGSRITGVEPSTMPQNKPSTAEKPCNHLFDLIDQLMKIENKKPNPIPHRDNSAPESAISSHIMYYALPQAEWQSHSETSLPVTDYVFREYIEVPIVYAFN